MDINLLKKYAKLAVTTGVNIQKDNILVITSPIETAEFARLITEEAYKAGVLLEVVQTDDYTGNFSVYTTYVTYDVIKKLSNTQNPQRVIGVCKKIDEKEIGNKIVILEDLQDPGNLGTIIRSSVAFNVDTIVVSNNTVDIYNDKVLRSSEGMLFHINIVKKNIAEI
jgi:TrmH family RNA methyltransferase